MSIQSFIQQLQPVSALVDADGIPTTSYGRAFLLALWNRTGGGTGIIPSVSALLTATGTVQGDALAVTNDWNWFGTVGAGSGAIILPLKPGNDIQFFNGGANALKVYPPVGAQIDALAINAAFSLAAGKLRVFECWSMTQFLSYGN